MFEIIAIIAFVVFAGSLLKLAKIGYDAHKQLKQLDNTKKMRIRITKQDGTNVVMTVDTSDTQSILKFLNALDNVQKVGPQSTEPEGANIEMTVDASDKQSIANS